MHADLYLIILAALVVLAVVYRGLAWVYLPPRNLPGSGGARRQLASKAGMAVIPTAGADGHLYPLEMSPEAVPWAGESGSDVMDEGKWVKEFTNRIETPWVRTDDDEWADQLHAINQAVSHKVWSWFQEKMVPVSEVTHYEVEGLIRTLAVPEWVPDRYRMAA